VTLTLQPIPGSILDQHEFHSKSIGSAVVTRHGEENAVGKFGLRARWQADGGIAVAEGRFNGCDELRGIEEAANVGFGEVRVGHSVGARRTHSTEKKKLRTTFVMERKDSLRRAHRLASGRKRGN
jgi:hypothetical protein